MRKYIFYLLQLILLSTGTAFSQPVERFLSDTTMAHASYSLYVAEAVTGIPVLDINSDKSLTPASVLKLVTSAAALELLGPEYLFRTTLGYTGKLSGSGKLDGDLVIKGGGDPSFASPYFSLNYSDFPRRWIDELRRLGIKKITGRVISDDSWFDYQPVPRGWIWEDPGNYYGAGVYGLSIYDNSYEIRFNTSSPGTKPVITGISPEECQFDLTNYLVAEGTTDKGYVFAAPYSTSGWIAGSIPVNKQGFILGAAITDPPLVFAKTMDHAIKEAGIQIAGSPTTVRIEKSLPITDFTFVAEYASPELRELIEILNHESVNLYAETLVKEIGKKYKGTGSTRYGLDIINMYLDTLGLEGMFLTDGSGLSPSNSINSKGLVQLLIHMKNNSRHFEHFYNSIPEPGQGTLKNWFRDEIFAGCFKAKSGSMTRVRSYAGYFTARSGKEMAFSFITNDYEGSPQIIVTHYERILKEIILSN